MGSLQIDVFDPSFVIQVNESDEYLHKLLGYYKKIIERIQNNGALKNPLQVSSLAGIMLCDELYKEKGRKVKFQTALEKNSTDEEADKITKSLIEKIDQVLK